MLDTSLDHTRNQTNTIIMYFSFCLAVLPLAFMVTVWVLIARAGDLHVAKVPAITEEHRQRASELASMSDDDNDSFHVIIVGAGAAGMSAAYTLDYLGLSYTVLEASSDTVGGRVRQISGFTNVPLDAGAEWIHVMPRVLQDLLLYPRDKEESRRSIDILAYSPDTTGVYTRGKRRSRNWYGYFYQEYKFVNTTWWSYFANYMYPYIQDRIVFDAFVDEIKYESSSSSTPVMTVWTADGRRFTASHVILTAPTRILQDWEIEFTPDLDDKTWDAIDEIEVADGMKVWFQFDKDFYPDMQFTGRLWESKPLYFDAVLGKPTDDHVLCLFHVNSDSAAEHADWTDDEILQEALNELATIFERSDLASHVMQTRVQNWSREPFIWGAYTWNYGYYRQEDLKAPLYDGHLYLAGEHVAAGDEYTATVHGAAITGREAVLKLLSAT